MFGYYGHRHWPGYRGQGHWSGCQPWAGYYYPYPFAPYPGPSVHQHGYAHCPACGRPSHLCCCEARAKVLLPQEVTVDASKSPKSTFIGGGCGVKLTLEYMPEEGAASPAVKVDITEAGTTTSWAEPAIPDGYNVKSDFPKVAPGGKVTIEVTEAIARLRWCEVLEC